MNLSFSFYLDRVTRLGEISQFGLLFKDAGIFGGEVWFVAGILRA
jgi:hypothetical protein